MTVIDLSNFNAKESIGPTPPSLLETMEKIFPQSDRSQKGFDDRRVKHAIRALKANGNLHEYDALSTIDGAIVSQYEDAVVFVDGEKPVPESACKKHGESNKIEPYGHTYFMQ